MEALLNDFISHGEHPVIATTAAVSKPLIIEENGIRYYALPDAPPILYNENKKSNIEHWEELLKEVNPDIIQVWGTEFTHGLCALRIAERLNIPSVIYMQGYLGAIAKNYLAGISKKDIKKNITFRDIVKRDSILAQQQRYYKNSAKEKEMLKLSGNIISENDWCTQSIRAIVPHIKSYYCPLSINKVFFEQNRAKENIVPHSVICNASGYTIKGLHIAMRAVAQLKEKYSDIRLLVPGTPQVSNGDIKSRLRRRGYTKYIEKLIKELDIEKNIVWLGEMTQEKLAQEYTKAQVFVMPSAIENHSSSLKEAMAVGLPCIASAVGGIPEYVKHGENGFLYNFSEYDVLAGYIDRIFENEALADAISKNAKQSMQKLHKDNDMFLAVLSTYKNILGEK